MRKKFSVFLILVLVLTLPVLVMMVGRVTNYFGKASGREANIVVDTGSNAGFLPRPWRGLAQGGEELKTFLNGVETDVRSISPEYIRIDHIYDGYNVVRRENGRLVFDFRELDMVVDKIRRVGAVPFLALSYMPPSIAQTDIVSMPSDMDEWSFLVQKTIEHYSGRREIFNMYYEVWNEPDLFGKMKVANYMNLYRASALGASRAQNVLAFKIGGPATTGLYKNWVDGMLKTAREENLRLDFVSWHRYDTDPERYIKDIAEVESWISEVPEFADIEVIMTEWGPYSENNPIYDNKVGAAHMLSVIRRQMGRINLAMPFSIKDGEDPQERELWGRWGLFTSDMSGNLSKPRYTALRWLTDLGEERLILEGEGTWVTGVAARKNGTTQVILTNYDISGRHSETVPLKFTGLSGSNYSYREKFMSGAVRNMNMTAANGEISQLILVNPNESVFIELIPS